MRGSFVRARLIHLAALTRVTVVAPVAALEYGNPDGMLRPLSAVRRELQDGPLQVRHPRWLYPPGIRLLHPAALAACSAGTVFREKNCDGCDVIDAHFGHPDGVAAAMLAALVKVPFVVTLRGSETVHAASSLIRAQLGWALRRAANVIAVSRPLAQFASELGVPASRLAIIPNGVDSSQFRPLDRSAWRHRFGMAEDRLHIVSVGHLIEGKGHHRIVEALPRLHAAGLKADLWVVGGSGNAPSFAEAIRRSIQYAGLSQYVHLLGSLPPSDVAGALNAADLLCLASSREGSPNVVNEALACGVPVVATRVGNTPEILAGDQYGILAAVDDPAALFHALEAGLRRTWDRQAISTWGARRTWSHVAAETFDVLRSAATCSRRNS